MDHACMYYLPGNLTSTSISALYCCVMWLFRLSCQHLSRVACISGGTVRVQHFVKFHFRSTVFRSFKHEQNTRESAAWAERQKKLRSTVYYVVATAVLTVGLSYAAVPLYRMFCQAYSYGGTTGVGHDADKVETMVKVRDRVISVRFNADTAASMRWNFRPQQTEIKVSPGETALAFYTACNPTDDPVTGISTYNVIPFEAGQYFNKIQCFCFEEQLLNPHEQVDMPVFFYIDPEFAEDPKMEAVDTLTLSYTFFEAKAGLKLPVPSFMKQ